MQDFTGYPDLAARALAGSVIDSNDDLFASHHNLITPYPVAHDALAFGHTGKIYDGWETRRRREPGSDWAIIRLGVPGIVHGVVVDTAFFRGNYPPHISIEATSIEGYPAADVVADAEWVTLVTKSSCAGDTRNLYPVEDPRRWTHVRLTIFPDGGVSRFRVHGEAVVDPRFLPTTVDLVAAENGGRLLDTSNSFYSSPANIIQPGRARIMGDGWENSRRRGDGNDWAIFELGVRGIPTLLEVDTSYFLGNAPGEVRLSAADARSGALEDESSWWPVVAKTAVLVDTRHRFLVADRREATHLRLDVYPDGGLARLRCFGEITDEARAELYRRFFSLLPEDHQRHLDAQADPDTAPAADEL